MGRDWSYDRDGENDGGKERWLITYADLITLLMVFFVVMYALSPRVSSENFDKLKSSLSTSLKKTTESKAGDKQAFSAVGQQEDRQMKSTAESVVEAVVATDPKSNVKVDIDERGVVVSLIDTSFFESGSATLKPGARQLLKNMAAGFKKLPNDVRIEGHTDNIPINTARFPSNWELSTARAAEVARFLDTAGGLESTRLSAVGYADNKPVASNGTPDGRRRNRRVEMILVRRPDAAPVRGAVGEPPAPAAEPVKPAAPAKPVNPFENGAFKNPFAK